MSLLTTVSHLNGSKGLRQAFASSVSAERAADTQGWASLVLVSAGVPYLEALRAFQDVIDKENHSRMSGVVANRRMDHLENIMAILEAFERSAASVSFGSQASSNAEVSHLFRRAHFALSTH